MSQRTAVITGGAGFIGSHLADRLIAKGWHVRIVDNESTGHFINVPSNAVYIIGDIRNKDLINDTIDESVDTVFHLAAQVSGMQSFVDPINDSTTNLIGTINVVERCIKSRVNRLLFASSMALYGQSSFTPISEDQVCEPVSYYGVSKLAAEKYILATSRRTDLKNPLNVTSLRMFNVYGPRQDIDNFHQGVLSVFIARALRNQPFTVFGDGKQIRDFIFIDDVINAWYLAIDNPSSYGQCINIGSGMSISLNELLALVLSEIHSETSSQTIEYTMALPGDQEQACANIEKAKTLLDWQPLSSLDHGLKTTIDWAKEQIKTKSVSKPPITKANHFHSVLRARAGAKKVIRPSSALIARIDHARKIVGEFYIPRTATKELDRPWQNEDLDLIESDTQHPLWWMIGPIALDLFGEDHEFDRRSRQRDKSESILMIPPHFHRVYPLIQSDLVSMGISIQKKERVFSSRFVGLLYGGYPWFESYLEICKHYDQLSNQCIILEASTNIGDIVSMLKDYKTNMRGQIADCLRISCPNLHYPGILRAFHTPSHIENTRHVLAAREA